MPKGGNDNVYTPDWLARAIMDHFKPDGKLLEPCRGKGAFYKLMPKGSPWCEIAEGRDFMAYKGRVDWVVTNPPWSELRAFLKKSMEVADNVVFLCLVNAIFMKARMRDIREAGFVVNEILLVPTPKAPWTQTGFCLGAVHICKTSAGDTDGNLCRISHLDVPGSENKS